MALGQRVRKRQPEGGSIGFGGSPVIGGRTSRSDGSIVGAEAKSAWVRVLEHELEVAAKTLQPYASGCG